MCCAEKIWALICHAGSAPEASIGSKPMGSELDIIYETTASKCQGFLDWPDARSRLGGWPAAHRQSIQQIEIIDFVIGNRPEAVDPGRQGARR